MPQPRILITGGVGYIGSRLREFLPEADSVDTERFGKPASLPNRKCSYQELTQDEVAGYDVIVHLAAHSSVAMCAADPEGATDNNIIGFANLMRLCQGKRLVYASSSSVYNGSGTELATEWWDRFTPTNRYDVSKHVMDLLSLTGNVEFYSLRLGTVCGWSPNLRNDLMINRMVQNGCDTGVVKVVNPHVNRPILDIEDLCRAVRVVVDGGGPPAIYNLASFNSTVDQVGSRVAAMCAARVEVGTGPTAYDFSMSSSRFCEAFGFTFQGRIESIVAGLRSRAWEIRGGRS